MLLPVSPGFAELVKYETPLVVVSHFPPVLFAGTTGKYISRSDIERAMGCAFCPSLFPLNSISLIPSKANRLGLYLCQTRKAEAQRKPIPKIISRLARKFLMRVINLNMRRAFLF